jgi:hypothetical protein
MRVYTYNMQRAIPVLVVLCAVGAFGMRTRGPPFVGARRGGRGGNPLRGRGGAPPFFRGQFRGGWPRGPHPIGQYYYDEFDRFGDFEPEPLPPPPHPLQYPVQFQEPIPIPYQPHPLHAHYYLPPGPVLPSPPSAGPGSVQAPTVEQQGQPTLVRQSNETKRDCSNEPRPHGSGGGRGAHQRADESRPSTSSSREGRESRVTTEGDVLRGVRRDPARRERVREHKEKRSEDRHASSRQVREFGKI